MLLLALVASAYATHVIIDGDIDESAISIDFPEDADAEGTGGITAASFATL